MEELPKIPLLLRITPENRLVYPINLTVNNVNSRSFSEIHMDPHCFEGSKKKSVSPELIYYFALKLNNNQKPFIPEERKDGWEFFAKEAPQMPFYYQNQPYRLVWCWQDNGNFIGIITCTPIRKSKKYKYEGQ